MNVEWWQAKGTTSSDGTAAQPPPGCCGARGTAHYLAQMPGRGLMAFQGMPTCTPWRLEGIQKNVGGLPEMGQLQD